MCCAIARIGMSEWSSLLGTAGKELVDVLYCSGSNSAVIDMTVFHGTEPVRVQPAMIYFDADLLGHSRFRPRAPDLTRRRAGHAFEGTVEGGF